MAVHSLFILISLYNEILHTHTPQKKGFWNILPGFAILILSTNCQGCSVTPQKRGLEIFCQVLLPSYFPPTVEVAVSQPLGGAWVRAQPCSTVGSSVHHKRQRQWQVKDTYPLGWSTALQLAHNSVLVTIAYKRIHAGDELIDIDNHNELGFLSHSH